MGKETGEVAAELSAARKEASELGTYLADTRAAADRTSEVRDQCKAK